MKNRFQIIPHFISDLEEIKQLRTCWKSVQAYPASAEDPSGTRVKQPWGVGPTALSVNDWSSDLIFNQLVGQNWFTCFRPSILSVGYLVNQLFDLSIIMEKMLGVK